MIKKIFAITVLAILMNGCLATVKPVIIPSVSNLKAIQVSAQNNNKVFINDISITTPSTKIGQAKTGTLCVGGTDLLWKWHTPTLTAMTSAVKEAFASANYQVALGLLKDKAQNESDILVAGSVTDLKGNLCLSIKGQKGDIYAEVSWEIYNKKKDESITLKTQGVSSSTEFKQAGDSELFASAVKMATKNLLANPEVHKLLTD